MIERVDHNSRPTCHINRATGHNTIAFPHLRIKLPAEFKPCSVEADWMSQKFPTRIIFLISLAILFAAYAVSESESSALARTMIQSGNTQATKNPLIAELEKKIAGQEEKPAGEVFKNIQVFKNMPAGRLLRVMEFAFTGSLGVDCSHCHTPGEWEKEDKPAKETARKMWGLMGRINNDLKQTIGKGTVNCTTCHRGQVKPALNLPSAK